MQNKEYFKNYMNLFLDKNAKLNLISKNDEKLLWEKHVYDSLCIEFFFKHYPEFMPKNLLDIGTGGGFPSIPAALAYPEIDVYALDSIRKKVNAITEIKSELGIENLYPVCDRAENINEKFDIITSRAVASLDKLLGYAMPLLKKDGYFIAYKSVKAQEEITEAKYSFKKHKAEVVNVIEYKLPLEENHTRNLVIIKHQ